MIQSEIIRAKKSSLTIKTIKIIEKMENSLDYIDISCYFAYVRQLYVKNSEIKNIDILKTLKILADEVMSLI